MSKTELNIWTASTSLCQNRILKWFAGFAQVFQRSKYNTAFGKVPLNSYPEKCRNTLLLMNFGHTIYTHLGPILFYSVIETDKQLTILTVGFVCVRGFEQKTRAPRPLMARLHFPASKLKKNKT